MKLILLRHAKSGWDDPGLPDHDRPLAPRGRRAAPALGGWLRAGGHLPDRVLCSSALRTRQTLELLGLPPCETRIVPELYLASAGRVLAVIERGRAGAGALLVVGHNPGIAQAAAMCVREPPPNPAFARFPTGACLVAELDGAPPGRTIGFTVPRELSDHES